ncbi:MAG: glucose-1-phosphate cytidylyltransferase [Candidatus Nanopelagicales bacterium]|nr:glucose-1-phosphate cytidylyltransferase [Candidatus Nanopelagicales bacterium]MCF8557991.1 glucose-1-phosphate cytidylyltransferase [Candidatus Nanopelagicales bacterium]
MKVVLLAGGLGTRLREETEFRPKPMVDVGGRPILWHIMKRYASYGHKDFIICTGYRGEFIRRYFLDFRAMTTDFTLRLEGEPTVQYHADMEERDWTVTICDTGPATPTGGRILHIQDHIGGEPFLCTYGDGLSDVDINAVISSHEDHGTLATVTAVRPVTRFGVLEMDDAGRVRDFREKTDAEGWINAGFFVFQPEVFNYLREDSILEHEPLTSLAHEGQLQAYRHDGFFQPMDTYREYTLLNDMWNSGDAPWSR